MIRIAAYFVLRSVARPTPRALDRAMPEAAVSFALGACALGVVWSKPTFAIPIVVLLIALGRPRLAIAGTVVGATLSAVVLPFLIDAAGGVSPLVQSWRNSARITSQSLQSRLGSGLRIDAGNTFERITHSHPSEGVAAIGGLVLLAAGAWLISRLHRRDPEGDREELTITIVCLLVLTSMYHVPYDYLLLVAPALMLARPRAHSPIAWPRRVRTWVLLLLLVPVVGPLGWSPIHAVLGKSGFQWMLGPTMLSTYVLTALGLCAWTALRVSATTPVSSISA